MTAIRAYERRLCQELVAGLRDIQGLRIYGITDVGKFNDRVPTVSFIYKDIPPKETCRRLDKENIFVWDGNFDAISVTARLDLENSGGLVRVGLCHYNTLEEVKLLTSALSQIQR